MHSRKATSMQREHPVQRVSFRDSDHSYFLDGKRVPSVTTILGNLSKPGLHFWSANKGAEAVKDFVASLPTAEIDGQHVVVVEQRHLAEVLYTLAKTSHQKHAQKAAAKGSIAHDAIQQYHESFFEAEPPDEYEHPLAYAAFDAFVEWWSISGLTCISTERKIVSNNDDELQFAGRLDMLCEDEAGGLYVCDVKTSNNLYLSHILQNAAYAQAISVELERPVVGTKVIWLPASRDYATVIERDEEEWKFDYSVFSMLHGVHAYRKGMKAWLDEVTAIPVDESGDEE